MTTTWAIVFAVLFVIQIAGLILSKYVDSQPCQPDYLLDEGITPELLEKAPEVLNQYGIMGNENTPELIRELSDTTREFFEKYSSVVFDDTIQIADRSFLKTPFQENMEYLQIGESFDRDPILVKRNSQDDIVYRVNSDEGDPLNPCPYASSITHYIMREYSDYKEYLEECNTDS